jgi:hypothetical protein
MTLDPKMASKPSTSAKTTVLFREGWLGILLACVAFVDAAIATKAFAGARLFVYAIIAASKRRDRRLNICVYLSGAFFALTIVASVSNNHSDFLLNLSYLLSVSLLFAYLSIQRLRRICRMSEGRSKGSDLNI